MLQDPNVTGQERPAYLQFETVSVEDRAASVEAGHPVYKDVHYVNVTAPGGSNTVVRKPARKFLEQKRNDTFYQHYKHVYEAWCEGQDEPVEGTPLKMWPPITPAQLSTCIAANIRTVEDLAAAPEQALSKMGMGARALQQKAAAWLSSASGDGKAAEEIAQLKRDNEEKDRTIERLEEKVNRLAGMVEGAQSQANGQAPYTPEPAQDEDDEEQQGTIAEPPKRKRGRPPKQQKTG